MKRAMADALISVRTLRQVSSVIVMKGLCYGPMARDVRLLLLVSDTVPNTYLQFTSIHIFNKIMKNDYKLSTVY